MEEIQSRGQQKELKLFALFLGLSLLVHLVFVFQKFLDATTLVSRTETKKQSFAINLNNLPSMTGADLKTKQIVQTEDRGEHKKPEKEAFLGEKDVSYERESLASKVDIFNKAAKGNGSVDTPQVNQQKTVNKEKAKSRPQPNLKDLSLADLGVKMMEKVSSEQEVQKAQNTASKAGAENGDASSRGVASTNDYVKDVTLGDFTQLNTVEYKYYGFYHRIRQKLEQFWGDSIQEKADAIYRSGRRIPASDNHITSVQVALNNAGEIVSVKIKSTSGVKELDDAAVESFNKAGPFPNPPKDLLVNGVATIEWGFVVNT